MRTSSNSNNKERKEPVRVLSNNSGFDGVEENSFEGVEDLDLDSILSGFQDPPKVEEPEKQRVEKEKKSKDTKGQQKPNKKEKPIDNGEFALQRPSTKRIVGAVFFGLLFSAGLSGVCYAGYMNYIKYPKAITVSEENTGLYCLQNWDLAVANLDSTGKDSYLHLEIDYANDNENKIEFYKKMASTVSYAPYYVKDVNVFGNTLLNRDDEVQYRPSTIGEGEYVIMSYINYDQVPIVRNVVNILMEEADLKVGDVDYPNKLVDVFCQYMNSLDDEDLPLKQVRRIPYMVKVGDSYQMDGDEDIYLDRLLFSSDSLYRLMDRFSAVASSLGVANPEWETWDALPADKKNTTEEPPRELEEIAPTQEWLDWNKLTTAQKSEDGVTEPDKYNWKEVMDKSWCGTFYLQNEYTTVDENGNTIRKEISAEVGDGSFENPAGMNTDVVTSIFVDEKNEDGEIVTNEYPISVRMVEYGVSEEAVTWFEDQDDRNRGIDVSSEVQYAYYVFEVTNMSDKELTIYDNSSLCDSNANVTSRTGIMYGLQDQVTLQPDETGIIETWGRSTELNKRYVIWGADFARRVEPVWFRVLAGDIDDPSENKGVTINDTRRGDEEETTPTVTEIAEPEEE